MFYDGSGKESLGKGREVGVEIGGKCDGLGIILNIEEERDLEQLRLAREVIPAIGSLTFSNDQKRVLEAAPLMMVTWTLDLPSFCSCGAAARISRMASMWGMTSLEAVRSTSTRVFRAVLSSN